MKGTQSPEKRLVWNAQERQVATVVHGLHGRERRSGAVVLLDGDNMSEFLFKNRL